MENPSLRLGELGEITDLDAELLPGASNSAARVEETHPVGKAAQD
jgi:hypothetical protein